MPKPQLSYSEKLQFLSDLRNFYMNDFWMIYDDIPAELWRFKWLSIWLVIDSLKIFFKWNKQPTKDEIILVLSHVLNKEKVINIEKKELEKVWWIGIKTSLI